MNNTEFLRNRILSEMSALKQGCEECIRENAMEYCQQNLASYKGQRSVISSGELPRSSGGRIWRKTIEGEWTFLCVKTGEYMRQSHTK
ncbi:MAG: hypothetical protein ACLPVI_08195 [Dehalococcoidales bacterium]